MLAQANLRLGIMGAGGRMGRMLIQTVLAHPNTVLAAAIEHPDSSLIGADAAELVHAAPIGVPISASLEAVIDTLDVLIDFSLPDATCANAICCAQQGVAMVIGTTGLNPSQEAELDAAAKHVALVYAGNYSTGVNVSLKLVEMAAQAFGKDADIEIVESHHKHKIDAPSGTAFMLAQAAADARDQDLNEVVIYGRQGQTGARKAGSIGIHAVRGGEIIGDHTVLLIAEGETVEITHRAQARSTFAAGAVKAALWAAQQPCGRYDMQDVLKLS